MLTCERISLLFQFHYTQKVDFAQLKSEMQLVEKNDLALMKAENDRLMAEVDKLKQRLREEITRSQAGFRLDLNLEKGAIFSERESRYHCHLDSHPQAEYATRQVCKSSRSEKWTLE